MIMWIGGMQTLRLFWGAAIAQWILRRLPSCRPGFESLSHHVCFHQFIEFCNVEKTKINRKGSDIGPFFLKKNIEFFSHANGNSLSDKQISLNLSNYR